MALDTPGDGLSAPIPESREPDPLDPAALARREMDAREAIRQWDRMVRIAREPESQPEYGPLREVLADHARELAILMPALDAAFEADRRAYLGSRSLDMTRHENIRARRDFGLAYEAALAARSRADRLLLDIRKRLQSG